MGSLCTLGLLGVVPAQGAERPDCIPLVPPWLVDCVIYHNACDDRPETPDVNIAPIGTVPGAHRGQVEVTRGPIITTQSAFIGKSVHVQDWRAPLMLRSPVLSPHRPLTLAFWWALPADLKLEGGYSLFELTGAGYIGLFCRGKGQWCALQRPAGVFQVYYFDGIQSVNGIYDYDILAHMDLRAGVWHHSAVVFRQATTAQVYTDGKPVFEVTIKGREFSEKDGLISLALGGPLYLDEIMVLDRAIDGDMIADYVRGVARLREYATSD